MKLSRFARSSTLALALCTLAGGGGCSKIIYAPQYQTGSVTHVVLFTLKDNANAPAALQQFKAAALELRKIPGVYDIEMGPVYTAANGSADFDIGMTVFFRDEATFRAYANDPIHQRLAKDVFLPASSKVVAHDFTNQEYQ